MTSGNKVRFSYGKKIYDIFHYVKVGILLKGSIDLISLVPGVKKEKIFMRHKSLVSYKNHLLKRENITFFQGLLG